MVRSSHLRDLLFSDREPLCSVWLMSWSMAALELRNRVGQQRVQTDDCSRPAVTAIIATSLASYRRVMRRRVNTARWVIAVGALMLLVGVAPAGAASLVYLDAASNVWIASPDGAVKRQLTSDAKPDSLYLSPSMQDDGTVVVPNQDGFTRVLNPDGTKKSGPWINPAPALFNTALNWADAAPTGNFYLTAQITAPFGGSPDPTVSLAALNAPGTSDCAVYVLPVRLGPPAVHSRYRGLHRDHRRPGSRKLQW
jgi:hypothetical protein